MISRELGFIQRERTEARLREQEPKLSVISEARQISFSIKIPAKFSESRLAIVNPAVPPPTMM